MPQYQRQTRFPRQRLPPTYSFGTGDDPTNYIGAGGAGARIDANRVIGAIPDINYLSVCANAEMRGGLMHHDKIIAAIEG